MKRFATRDEYWPVNGPAVVVFLDGSVLDIPEGRAYVPDADASLRTDYVRVYPTGWNPPEPSMTRRSFLRRLLRMA